MIVNAFDVDKNQIAKNISEIKKYAILLFEKNEREELMKIISLLK